jgi:hypothetical protein
MTVEDANFAMQLVSNLYDETRPDQSAETIRQLTTVLIEQPEIFWEKFSALSDPALRERCEALVRSGAYVPSAWMEQLLTIAEVQL